MKVILVTHNRQPSYVGDTLESMFRNDDMRGADIHVLVHESDSTCLGGWEQSSRLKIHTCTDEQLQEKSKLARRAKCAHVTRLGLELADDECVFLQDDAVFLPYWWTRLQTALETLGPNRQWCMVSLCYHLTFPETSGLVPWDVSTYFGTVAFYGGSVFRKEAVKALAPKNRAWDTDNPGVGGDVRIKDMLTKRQRDFRLYALRPQLVFHTGEVSSIGSRTETARKTTGRNMKGPL